MEKLNPSCFINPGNVVKRSKETQNKDLKTGLIEIKIKEFEVLSAAKELPMPVFENRNIQKKLD